MVNLAPVIILKNLKDITVTVTTAKGIIGSIKSMLPSKIKVVTTNEYRLERAECLIEEALGLLGKYKTKAHTRVFITLAINSLKMALYNVKRLRRQKNV